MLLHILKKDLKRKRTMNIILLLFIMLASTFLAASTSNMITITGALDCFMNVSDVPDYFMIKVGETDRTPLDDFLEDCEYITEYETRDTYMITDEDIEIISCAAAPDMHQYNRGNTVMLEPVPENFAKVFDEKNNPLTLQCGEIALPASQANANELQVGDRLKIMCGDGSMEFTIRAIVKDALLGSEMMGPKRLFINEEDFEKLAGKEERYHTMLYHINCTDKEAFLKEFKKENISVIGSVDKATVKMCYFFDLVLAGILVIVGICMILVSFLILRFTIVFTLQEDYKEIGIMKAIGIRDMRMKGIYLLKYFVIALVGSAFGLLCSFPLEKMLLASAMKNFVTPDVRSNAVYNILCAILIVFIVLLFCYGCTGKIKKYTVIEAIRRGSNGERYNAGGKIRLHKRGSLRPFMYMACNDVVSNVKRYLILALIFCIGTLEILLPLMTVHTLKDESIIRTFNMQPASVFIDTGEAENYVIQSDDSLIRSDMRDIQEKLAQHGLEVQVWIEMWYVISCYGENDSDASITATYTSQQIGLEEDDYDVLEGSVPLFDNEVMVTEKTAGELGVSIGDTVHYQFPEEEKEFIVTGIYQTMMNMGYGLRVSKDAELPYQTLGGIFSFQVQIESELNETELKEAVEDIFPDYKISTTSEYMGKMIGVIDQLDALQFFVTALVLVINVLITVLMVKTFITKERGEIAMLKSIGFADRTIRGWQSMRIVCVLAAAILAGTLLSRILGPVTVGAVFSVMGATSIKLVANPLEAYVLYPVLMLAVTGSAAYLCAAEVKKVDTKEINTIE